MTSPNNIHPREKYTDEQREMLAGQIAAANKTVFSIPGAPGASIHCDFAHGYCHLRFLACGQNWPSPFQLYRRETVFYRNMLKDPNHMSRRVHEFLDESIDRFKDMDTALSGPSRDYVISLLEEIDELTEEIEGLQS